MSAQQPSSQSASRCGSCPVCFGSGQITGPKSWIYQYASEDPFNAVIRLCDECEGTGVVTLLTSAAIEAAAMQRVMPIVDKVMGEWRDDLAAIAVWEAEGGLCVSAEQPSTQSHEIAPSDTGNWHGPLWRECGELIDDGSGKVCRRICAQGRDYHGGGHWFADPAVDGDHVRLSTARWLVTGRQPGEAGAS